MCVLLGCIGGGDVDALQSHVPLYALRIGGDVHPASFFTEAGKEEEEEEGGAEVSRCTTTTIITTHNVSDVL